MKIEEIDFSIAQGKGIANIDNMNKLRADVRPLNIGRECLSVLEENIPGKFYYQYEGSLVSCNRGILHIHDAFGKSGNAEAYRPLLMLLGSGKIAVESTQTSIDTTVVMTTNLEEMESLEDELTSSKLLDRIEKVPVNYLLDSNSERDILKRDMVSIERNYDIDPNLYRIASYYSVITRLFPPDGLSSSLPANWSEEKVKFYRSLAPEQKLFIYNSQSTDPIKTIKTLPPLHPFRSEATKLGIDLNDQSTYVDKIEVRTDIETLEESGLFTNSELKLIDDEFTRVLRKERYPEEGKYGMSVRQLQNVIRDTAASSDGTKMTVNQFISQLEKIITEGRSVHYWLKDNVIGNKLQYEVKERAIGNMLIGQGSGEYGSYEGGILIISSLYNEIIKKEITIATVDRDPNKIERDLRKYIQYILLHRARTNTKFQKQMLDKFSFVDSVSGVKIDKPDYEFMKTIEKVIFEHEEEYADVFRNEMADKFFKLQDSGELKIEDGKTVISSKNDNFKFCFSLENSKLLSHRKTIEGIDTGLLEDSFFLKLNSSDKYEKMKEDHPNVAKITETVIENMCNNNGYSREMALETIVYALSEDVVDFHKIIS
jgi:hypothetical protein